MTRAERSYPASEARGDWEKPPHARGHGPRPEEPPRSGGQGRQLGGATRGAGAARAQEGLEELSHIEGQEGRR